MSALLNGAIDVATDHLSEASEFSPFALAMQSSDGELLHLEPDADGGEVDDVEQVRAILIAGLQEGAADGRYRGVALVTDVTLEDESGEAIATAIHVALEHADHDPVTCVVPYTIGEEAVELGDLSAEPGERTVFKEVLQN